MSWFRAPTFTPVIKHGGWQKGFFYCASFPDTSGIYAVPYAVQ
jgi:hypothetical protein